MKTLGRRQEITLSYQQLKWLITKTIAAKSKEFEVFFCRTHSYCSAQGILHSVKPVKKSLSDYEEDILCLL